MTALRIQEENKFRKFCNLCEHLHLEGQRDLQSTKNPPTSQSLALVILASVAVLRAYVPPIQ